MSYLFYEEIQIIRELSNGAIKIYRSLCLIYKKKLKKTRILNPPVRGARLSPAGKFHPMTRKKESLRFAQSHGGDGMHY